MAPEHRRASKDPCHVGERRDRAGYARSPLPGLADDLDDGVSIWPEAVRDEAVLEEEPALLDRLQVWRVGWPKGRPLFSGVAWSPA